MNEHLTKPIDPNILYQNLLKFMTGMDPDQLK